MIDRRAGVFVLLALALGFGAAGCGEDATQLIVVVDSDLSVPAELSRIQVLVSGPAASQPPIDVELAGSGAPRLPLTLGVSPAGDALGPVTVRALGHSGGRVIVEASGRTTLVRGQSRVLWLFLGRSCVDEMCGSNERTCRDGRCASIDVPFGELPRWTGEIPARPIDAGPRSDAALDAALDADRDLDGAPDVRPRDLGPPIEGGPEDDAGPAEDAGPEEDSGPPPPPCPGGCDDGMACTIDRCDLGLGRCEHTPVDLDGDSYADAACGGEDCDDGDPAVHPAAREECDGDDDDCNGADDDGCPCSPLGTVEACTTSCGSSGMRACTASGWLDCVPPGESCNAVDDDCDGQVDEGHAYVATGARMLSASGRSSRRPAVAAGSDSIVGVWQREASSGVLGPRWVIEAMRVTSAGASDGAAMVVADRVSSVWPAITATTDGYALAWWEPTRSLGDPEPDGVGFGLLRADGSRAGPSSRVEDVGTSTPSPAIAWSGTELGVAYEGSDFWLERLSPTGMPLGGRQRIGGSVDSTLLALVWSGVEYAVLWREGPGMSLARGLVEPLRRTSITTDPRDEEDLALAATSRGFVAVAGDDHNDVFVHVSADGGETFRPGTRLSTAHSQGTSCDPQEMHGVASVTAGPDQVLVLWAEDGVVGGPGGTGGGGTTRIAMARFGADGTMLQPPTVVAGAQPSNLQPAAVWLGDHAVLLWSATAGSCTDRAIWSASVGCP